MENKEKEKVVEEKQINVIDEMLEMFGEKQIIKCIEEMSELTKAYCKAIIYDGKDIDKKRRNSIAEETADVYIMLETGRRFYGISEEEIATIMKEKLKRTYERYLKKDNEKN